MAIQEPLLKAEIFTVDAERDGDTLRLHASGELDLANAEAFERAVCEAIEGDAQRIVLDLSELQFIDSTGLKALVVAARAATTDSNRLGVVRPPAPVAHLLSLTGIDELLPFLD